jgi:MinD-like ATPase involved in chromosome partitioning or flagellar assembly
VQRLQCDVYLVLPANIEQDAAQAIRELSNVKAIYLGGLNWPEVTQKILSDVAAKRRFASEVETELWRPNSGISAGMYNIVFWNRCGGAGRTTIAVGFAEACAVRGIRTLLISLAAPCPLPYMLNLKAKDNISEWFARPSIEEGFKNAVQSYKENLDVIVGLQDAVKERDFMQDPKTNATINDLSIMAARTGYGVVVLDAPTAIAAGAGAAISAANYMVLVARPVISDIVASVEAFRLVLKNLSGQHVIKPGNVVCVLNRTQEGLLPTDSFHRMASEFLSKQDVQSPFPIIATTIKEDLVLQTAQNDGISSLQASDPFARSIHSLVGLILGAVDKNQFAAKPKKKKLFGWF